MVQSLAWNSLGQLTSVTTNGSTVSFGYDAFGRRVRKTVPGDVLWYVHDGDNVWTLADNDGAHLISITAYYPGVDQPHSIFQGGAISYYLQDVSGNVTGLVNNAQQLQNHYAYLPFGGADTTSETVTNTLRFAAREYDAETGLYYMRARYYDPNLGRFISEDPMGPDGGVNPYTYAGNAPLDRSDPSGFCTNDMGQFRQTMEDSNSSWCLGGVTVTATQTWFPSFVTGGPTSPFGPFGPEEPSHGGGGGPAGPSATPSVTTAAQSKSPQNRVCRGSFGFAAREADLGMASFAIGGIAESSAPGLDVGGLVEGGIGGEGGVLGLAVIRSARTGRISQFGFLGTGVSVGPLAGGQFGIIFNVHEIGLYYEGHLAPFAIGGGYAAGRCTE